MANTEYPVNNRTAINAAQVMLWCHKHGFKVGSVYPTPEGTAIVTARYGRRSYSIEIEDDEVCATIWLESFKHVVREVEIHELFKLLPTHNKVAAFMYSILGYLNFFIFQWFFTRLTVETNEIDDLFSWSFRYALPLTRWKFF